MLQASEQLPSADIELKQVVEKLERYLNDNQTRIDYQRYLAAGLMNDWFWGGGKFQSQSGEPTFEASRYALVKTRRRGSYGIASLLFE